MPYGPHTASDRERMLAALGLTSVDELFDDIPPAMRASPLDLPPPQPELELAARLEALAARNRASIGTGVRPRSTSSSCAASGTRPTRHTNPK